jgi:hypothetical protein
MLHHLPQQFGALHDTCNVGSMSLHVHTLLHRDLLNPAEIRFCDFMCRKSLLRISAVHGSQVPQSITNFFVLSQVLPFRVSHIPVRVLMQPGPCVAFPLAWAHPCESTTTSCPSESPDREKAPHRLTPPPHPWRHHPWHAWKASCPPSR